MSTPLIGRRQFLTLPLAALLAPFTASAHEAQAITATYSAEVGILYQMFAFHLSGSIQEYVDRRAGEYRIIAEGAGPGIANRVQSEGTIRNGRWTPSSSRAWFDVRGRQSSTEIYYRWADRQIEYHARGETFFLRRLRVVDDYVTVPESMHVDDAMSATLNFCDGRWPMHASGEYQTFVVRRRRADNEGPDDVASSYRAEIVGFELKRVSDASGKLTATFDLSRFSSWAKRSEPARIVFAEDRRPQLLSTSMILGTSVKIRFMTA